MVAFVYTSYKLFIRGDNYSFEEIVRYNFEEIVQIAILAANYYSAAMFLPSLAVTIRRLHDVGRGVWFIVWLNVWPVLIMVALLLIVMFSPANDDNWQRDASIWLLETGRWFLPLIAFFWLLILLMTVGQEGDNKYGSDPGTATNAFGESARLRNAGVVLIVAHALSLVMFIKLWLFSTSSFEGLPLERILLFNNLILLIAGVLLLNEKQLYGIGRNGRIAILLIMVAFTLSFVSRLLRVIFNIGLLDEWDILHAVFVALPCLSLALLAAFTLFAQHKKNIIRIAAILSIVFWGLDLLLLFYGEIKGLGGYRFYYLLSSFKFMKSVLSPVEPMLQILPSIACIVFAGTVLSCKNQQE